MLILVRQCQLDHMSTIGHGPSKSTCSDCYSVKMTQETPDSPFSFLVTGTQEYQGVLFMVKNDLNQTVGEFIDYDENVYAPVACDDDDEENKDAIENPGALGHLDAKWKSWPVQVFWQPGESVSTDLRFQGMVVVSETADKIGEHLSKLIKQTWQIDYDNYHIIPETAFKVHVQRTATTSVVSNLPQVTLVPPPPLVEEEEKDDDDREPITLFVQVLIVVFAIYFVMALVNYRWQKKKRRDVDNLAKDW